MIDLKKTLRASVATGLAGFAMLGGAPAQAAQVNVLRTYLSSISTVGTIGILRAGSPWGPGSTDSALQPLVNGFFQPEGTQWNNGSLWWDQDPSVNRQEVLTTIRLDRAFTFSKFVMQADDNDGYTLEYWDGAAWQLGWDFGTQPSFGLVTRPDANVNFTTDFLRIRAYGGDNYFAVSELQGFASVPEPAAWAMMLGGFGLVGSALRRRTKVSYAA
jgi:hypothetical protein